jgi:hypothetical protein
MAILYISEYNSLFAVPGQVGQMAMGAPVVQQTVAIGAGSVQSAALGGTSNFIRVHTDVICSIAFGTNPTATVTSMRLAANQTEYFGVGPGTKVAVIANT